MTIGNHTCSHNMQVFWQFTIQYQFVQDVKCDNAIKTVLGQDFKTNLVRFPGGSHHKSYENELLNAGFKLYRLEYRKWRCKKIKCT